MFLQEFLFALPYLLSLALALFIFAYSAQRAHVITATTLSLYTLTQSVWILGFLLECFSPTLEAKLFWDNLQFIPFLFLPFFVSILARSYTGGKPLPLGTFHRWLLIVVVVLVVVVYTDPYHGLIRTVSVLRPAFPMGVLVYGYTPVMYLILATVLAVLGSALIRIGRYAQRSTGRRRAQGFWILGGLSIPMVAGILGTLEVTLGPHRDLSPLAFGLGDLVIAWGIFRHKIFEVLPVAYRTVFLALDDPLAVVDNGGMVIAHNPAFSRLVTEREQGITGQEFALLTARTPIDTAAFDLKTTPIHSEGGSLQATIYHFRDIRQTQMAALGRLADSVAHELNSPLASILSTTHQLQDWEHHFPLPVTGDPLAEALLGHSQIPDLRTGRQTHADRRSWVQRLQAAGWDEPEAWADLLREAALVPDDEARLLPLLLTPGARTALEKVIRTVGMKTSLWILQESAEKARSIISVLQQQEPSPVPEPRVPTTLEEVLGQAIEAERGRTGPELTVVLHVPPGLVVLARRSRLRQLFQQLIRNGVHAMDRRGKLTVRVKRVKATAVVEIEDQGHGIPQDLQPRIFEAFFSTKKAGEGSGFGLGYVQMVANEHGAHVSFESRPGRTVFRLVIPVVE